MTCAALHCADRSLLLHAITGAMIFRLIVVTMHDFWVFAVFTDVHICWHSLGL